MPSHLPAGFLGMASQWTNCTPIPAGPVTGGAQSRALQSLFSAGLCVSVNSKPLIVQMGSAQVWEPRLTRAQCRLFPPSVSDAHRGWRCPYPGTLIRYLTLSPHLTPLPSGTVKSGKQGLCHIETSCRSLRRTGAGRIVLKLDPVKQRKHPSV